MRITGKIFVIVMLSIYFIGGIMELSNYFIYYQISTLTSSMVLLLMALGSALTLFLLQRKHPRFSRWLHADMLHPNNQ
jgi:predicted RND superfamily exporter protein